MKIKSEADLRRWVKSQSVEDGIKVNWTKEERGLALGSVDCLIDVRGVLVPTRLKFWSRRKDGSLVTDMSPSQKNYYREAIAIKKKTLIIYAVKGFDRKSDTIIKVVSGHCFPSSKKSNLEFKSKKIKSLWELVIASDNIWAENSGGLQ